MKKLAIYIRTSTDKQEAGAESQLMSCKNYCEREKIPETDWEIFSDEDQSGKNDSRPEMDRMLAAIERGEVDRVLVYCLSRFSRDTVRCLIVAQEFRQKGVKLLSCTENLQTDTPEGRLLYGILALFGQFQREDIVRKVNNGLANAKRKGIKLGRKSERDDQAILSLIDAGRTYASTAAELGISKGAVNRAVKARKRAQPAELNAAVGSDFGSK